MNTQLLPQTKAQILADFTNPYTSMEVKKTKAEIVASYGNDVFETLLSQKVFWPCGSRPINAWETSINNWIYVPVYILNKEALLTITL